MSASALPPKGFVGAGKVFRAERAERSHFASVVSLARFARGLHYQQVVEHALSAWADARSEWFPKDAYPDNRIKRSAVTVAFGPWFRFTSSNHPGLWRWCQPDVLITSERGPPVVLEVKLTLEPRAWWQVVELYAPVVSVALGREAYGGIICKSADVREVRPRINGALVLTDEYPKLWLDLVAQGECGADDLWPLREAMPVLQWKRPSIDSASSESAARITSTNQPKAR